jgi:hypothetical protein
VTARRPWPGLACALAFAAVLGAPASRALASSACGKPDLLDTIPADTAPNVPPNGALSAHYDISAEYLGEDVVLTPPGGGDEVIKVTFDSTQGLLTFKPPTPLQPGLYKLAWPSLRGLNAAAPGKGATITFTVGAQPDVAAPVFEGLTAVRWDLERQKNDCTDSIESRMVFKFDLAPADDDGGRDGLTLVVFQTAGGSVEGSVPVLSQAMPAASAHPVVKLPVAEATGHVCFAALARDTTDRTSNSGSQEVCVETTAPPFFRGCSVAPRGGSGGTVLALAAMLAILSARSRRTKK